MQIQWTTIVIILFEWLLFSIALRSVAKKLGWKRTWTAWIPGVRFISLGKTILFNAEGIVCGILDIVYILGALAKAFITEGTLSIVLGLIVFVLYVFLFIYRIRFFLKIRDIFGLKRWWIILFLIANWLPLMIVGFGKKYQARKEMLQDESWEAGTKPAQIAGAENVHKAELSNEGLSVDLREKTVKDFSKKRYLLKDIALNIPNNSLVLLLGGSGAGKTTLINALIGYEKAEATVLLNGADVYKEYENVKYKIGYVPQKNLIRGKDTVKSTVNDAARMRMPKSITKEERKTKIEEVMDLLGLTAGRDGLVEKKSGGQLRRISIGMELINNPDLLVLDEPDSGLDGAIAREIFHKLRQIADEGRIVIVISHTPDRVIDMFDKVIVLARDSGRVGRLAFYGSPDEAREFFAKDTMEGIVMSINGPDEGGEGKADELIERYANRDIVQKEGEAS